MLHAYKPSACYGGSCSRKRWVVKFRSQKGRPQNFREPLRAIRDRRGSPERAGGQADIRAVVAA